MKKLIVLSSVFFVALSGILSPGLYAQDTLEEIVVTARKRQENLSEIPLSISVFSEEDIKESGFKNLEDLSLQVAGFQHSSQGCLLYTSPSPRDQRGSRMPSSA